jgi:NitT/TauT family transport system permease protein
MTAHSTRPRRLTRSGRWLRGAVGVAVLFAVSEGVTRMGLVDRSFLPPASSIVGRAGELAGDSAFLGQVRHTMTAWAAGMGIAIAIAIPLGLLLGTVPVISTASRAVVEFLRPIPSVALIPLAELLLGSGYQMEVTLVVYASVWPILFNTIYGLQDVDPVAKDTLYGFGFGRVEVLGRVSLPSAAPFIATGIRLAAAVALIVSVGSEIISGFGDGLGIFIGQAENAIDGTRDVLAGTVWAGGLGLLINSLLLIAENRLLGWERVRTEAAT